LISLDKSFLKATRSECPLDISKRPSRYRESHFADFVAPVAALPSLEKGESSHGQPHQREKKIGLRNSLTEQPAYNTLF